MLKKGRSLYGYLGNQLQPAVSFLPNFSPLKIRCLESIFLLQKLNADFFLDCFLLLRRKQLFFTLRTFKGFYVVQYDTVDFQIKNNLNVFDAAYRAKKSTSLGGASFIE